LRRRLFLVQVKAAIFLRYLPRLVDRAVGPRRFVLFLRRLLFFLSHLERNKFVTIGRTTRLNMYVPGFPSRAFFTACDKFLAFGRKLPCATALISVTSACRFKCSHCYQRLDKGHDMPLERLVPAIRALQDHGVAFLNIEGGEPFLVFDRLLSVCESIDRRSEIWINSTGDGITAERLEKLKKTPVTAIMFSVHASKPQELNGFMGSARAWDTMVRGIERCHEAGMAVAFNVCLGREGYIDGEFEGIMEHAYRFGAALVQLIMPKPAGAWLQDRPAEFSAEDITRVKTLVSRYNHDPAFRRYPPISAQINEEDPAMFGCTAGGTDRFYINAKGDVQPCEFLNLSFGSIVEEDFGEIFTRMREEFDRPGVRFLCQAWAPAIADALREEGGPVLPLSKEASNRVMAGWDRGGHTELYRKIQQELGE
jgi:MoaA/NifB/PqqE/SkfB family radical SAM enzyme